jgi:hypothetical protein
MTQVPSFLNIWRRPFCRRSLRQQAVCCFLFRRRDKHACMDSCPLVIGLDKPHQAVRLQLHVILRANIPTNPPAASRTKAGAGSRLSISYGLHFPATRTGSNAAISFTLCASAICCSQAGSDQRTKSEGLAIALSQRSRTGTAGDDVSV